MGLFYYLFNLICSWFFPDKGIKSKFLLIYNQDQLTINVIINRSGRTPFSF